MRCVYSASTARRQRHRRRRIYSASSATTSTASTATASTARVQRVDTGFKHRRRGQRVGNALRRASARRGTQAYTTPRFSKRRGSRVKGVRSGPQARNPWSAIGAETYETHRRRNPITHSSQRPTVLSCYPVPWGHLGAQWQDLTGKQNPRKANQSQKRTVGVSWGGHAKIVENHIGASHSRQALVKGERLGSG